MSTSAFNLFMENFPFRLFCDSFQKALSRVLEPPDPESNEDAANCHRLRHFFLLKLFFSVGQNKSGFGRPNPKMETTLTNVR